MDERLYETQAGTAGRETGEGPWGMEREPYPEGQQPPGQRQCPGWEPCPGGTYPGWKQQTVLDRQPDMGPGENYGADGPEQKNYMALASMVMGILSIVTACCFLAAFVLGGMAVIFAALSRVDERLCGRGKAGLITGIVGITVGLVSVVLWIALGA